MNTTIVIDDIIVKGVAMSRVTDCTEETNICTDKPSVEKVLSFLVNSVLYCCWFGVFFRIYYLGCYWSPVQRYTPERHTSLLDRLWWWWWCLFWYILPSSFGLPRHFSRLVTLTYEVVLCCKWSVGQIDVVLEFIEWEQVLWAESFHSHSWIHLVRLERKFVLITWLWGISGVNW